MKIELTLFLGGYDGYFFLKNILSYKNDYLIKSVFCVKENKQINDLCIKHNFSIFNIKRPIDFFEYKIDGNSILVSCGFQKLIPKKILDFFHSKAINIHAGILPKYRGIHGGIWAQINKEKFLGSTCHLIDSSFDSGNILYISKFRNSLDFNKNDLNSKLHHSNFESFTNGIRALISGYKGEIQTGGKNWKKRTLNDSFFDQSKTDLISFEHFHRALDRPGLYPFCFSDGYKYTIIEYSKSKSIHKKIHLKNSTIYLTKFTSEKNEN